MTPEDAVPHRDYEEALRSLGQLFDEGGFQDILLFESAAGFLVTALRTVDAAGPDRRFEFIERSFSDADIEQASSRGMDLRGTRHRADRNELALRLIGRHVNLRSGSRILVVDQGDSFVVRMLIDAEEHVPHSYTTITSAELEQMLKEAIGYRDIRDT